MAIEKINVYAEFREKKESGDAVVRKKIRRKDESYEEGDFSDFFIVDNKKELAIQYNIVIEVEPEGEEIEWNVYFGSKESEANEYKKGKGNLIDFAPYIDAKNRPPLKNASGINNIKDFFNFLSKEERMKCGSRTPNSPIEYLLKVNKKYEYTITQSKKACIIQEYIDFDLAMPDIKDIIKAVDIMKKEKVYFTSNDIAENCNYNPWIVNIDNGIYKILNALVESQHPENERIKLNSVYRNPMKNLKIGGAQQSRHLSGNAVDIAPFVKNVTTMASLYKTALNIPLETNTRKRVALERNSELLLPVGLQLPIPNGELQFNWIDNTGNGIVSKISFKEFIVSNKSYENPIPIDKKFVRNSSGDHSHFIECTSPKEKETAHGWNEKENFFYVFSFKKGSNKSFFYVESGDKLSLQFDDFHRIKNIEINSILEKASHIHIDTGYEVKPRYSFPIEHTEIKEELRLIERWGYRNNAIRLLYQIKKSPEHISTNIEMYKELEKEASERMKIIKIFLENDDIKNIIHRDEWKSIRWPDVNKINFDWNYTDIVIHHSLYEMTSDPLEIESIHINKCDFCDIGYHFLINEKGEIFEGRSLLFRGDHVENSWGKIGIILLGDSGRERGIFDVFGTDVYNYYSRYPQQSKSLIKLVVALKTQFTIKKIGGHRDYMQSSGAWEWNTCPGDSVYDALHKWETHKWDIKTIESNMGL